mmetsp:Transcript_27933/g.58538  ORF Transcript_27933/g.58538 Transcript_27933/m.58538 type:complete len:210 (-) Transcript_27933:62-691(-)
MVFDFVAFCVSFPVPSPLLIVTFAVILLTEINSSLMLFSISSSSICCCAIAAASACRMRKNSDRGNTTSPLTSTVMMLSSATPFCSDEPSTYDEGSSIWDGMPGICFAAAVTSCPTFPSPRVDAHCKSNVIGLVSSPALLSIVVDDPAATSASYRNDILTPSNLGSVITEIVDIEEDFECTFSSESVFASVCISNSFVAFTTLLNQLWS